MKRSMTAVAAPASLSTLADQRSPRTSEASKLMPARPRLLSSDPPLASRKSRNDWESNGTLVTTFGGHEPHVLRPGFCADDIGNTIGAVNQGSGPGDGNLGAELRAQWKQQRPV